MRRLLRKKRDSRRDNAGLTLLGHTAGHTRTHYGTTGGDASAAAAGAPLAQSNSSNVLQHFRSCVNSLTFHFRGYQFNRAMAEELIRSHDLNSLAESFSESGATDSLGDEFKDKLAEILSTKTLPKTNDITVASFKLNEKDYYEAVAESLEAVLNEKTASSTSSLSGS